MDFLKDPQFWGIIASFSNFAALIVLIVTAAIIGRQLREMTRTRHLEAMLKVYDLISSSEARSMRKFIYNELNSDPDKISCEERNIVEQVCVDFDNIGKLVKSRLVPANELLESHCEMFIRIWQKLAPYIQHHKEVVGGRHVPHFVQLAKLAQEYHSENFSNEDLRVVGVWKNNKDNQCN